MHSPTQALQHPYLTVFGSDCVLCKKLEGPSDRQLSRKPVKAEGSFSDVVSGFPTLSRHKKAGKGNFAKNLVK